MLRAHNLPKNQLTPATIGVSPVRSERARYPPLTAVTGAGRARNPQQIRWFA